MFYASWPARNGSLPPQTRTKSCLKATLHRDADPTNFLARFISIAEAIQRAGGSLFFPCCFTYVLKRTKQIILAPLQMLRPMDRQVMSICFYSSGTAKEMAGMVYSREPNDCLIGWVLELSGISRCQAPKIGQHKYKKYPFPDLAESLLGGDTMKCAYRVPGDHRPYQGCFTLK